MGRSVQQLLILLLGAAIVLFAVYNQTETTVDVIFTTVTVPTSLLILAPLLVGLILGWVEGRFRRRRARRTREEREAAERETAERKAREREAGPERPAEAPGEAGTRPRTGPAHEDAADGHTGEEPPREPEERGGRSGAGDPPRGSAP